MPLRLGVGLRVVVPLVDGFPELVSICEARAEHSSSGAGQGAKGGRLPAGRAVAAADGAAPAVRLQRLRLPPGRPALVAQPRARARQGPQTGPQVVATLEKDFTGLTRFLNR